MRMIDEKEIIEQNNRFEKWSKKRKSRVIRYGDLYLEFYLIYFLEKFPFQTLLIIVQFISNLFDPTFRPLEWSTRRK